jgi:hypothetical protein
MQLLARSRASHGQLNRDWMEGVVSLSVDSERFLFSCFSSVSLEDDCLMLEVEECMGF